MTCRRSVIPGNTSWRSSMPGHKWLNKGINQMRRFILHMLEDKWEPTQLVDIESTMTLSHVLYSDRIYTPSTIINTGPINWPKLGLPNNGLELCIIKPFQGISFWNLSKSFKNTTFPLGITALNTIILLSVNHLYVCMLCTDATAWKREKKRDLWAMANIRKDNEFLNRIKIPIGSSEFKGLPRILVSPPYQNRTLYKEQNKANYNR